MPGGRVRRPLMWQLLFLFALLLPLAGACRMPSSSSSAGTGTSEAAEKTKRMEEKSAEIEKHAEEVRNMQGTDQEKIDAMNSVDQERRELNEMDQGK
jgi:Sec-independent protein translocase protein TatA